MDGVLIVEDDRDSREALRELLEISGLPVTTAANGRVALDLIRREGAPKVILLDLMMPEMDGWELRRRLLADATLARVPVYVISALRDRLPPAVAGVFTKPIDPAGVAPEVSRYC